MKTSMTSREQILAMVAGEATDHIPLSMDVHPSYMRHDPKVAHWRDQFERTGDLLALGTDLPVVKVFNWQVVLLFCALLVGGPTSLAPGQTLQAKPFSMGVYMYKGQMMTAAAEQGKDYWNFFEEHLVNLQAHGVNAIHLGGVTYLWDSWGEHLRLAKKYDMKLLPQLDFAYFQPSWTDYQMDVYAQNAANFINQHNDPAILAWSVKEEVAPGDVNRLAQYYTKIMQYAPGVKFGIVHNDISAAQAQPVPDPIISGTDRYAFWWEVSGGGYLASPSFALDWTRTQAATYYKESAQRGADFMLVTTQGGIFMPTWANQIANDTSNPAMMNKVRQWAADGRMGWRVPGQRQPSPGGRHGTVDHRAIGPRRTVYSASSPQRLCRRAVGKGALDD